MPGDDLKREIYELPSRTLLGKVEAKKQTDEDCVAQEREGKKEHKS